MQKLLAFFLAMLLSVSVIAGCGSNSPKTDDKQTTQTTTVNTTKSNNGQNTAANVKANSGKIKISESAAYTDKEHPTRSTLLSISTNISDCRTTILRKTRPKSWAGRQKARSTRLRRVNPSAATAMAITKASCRRKTAATGRNATLIM